MSLSDKIKNAKRGHSLFDGIPPERMHALKMRGRVASVIAKKRQQSSVSSSVVMTMDNARALLSVMHQ